MGVPVSDELGVILNLKLASFILGFYIFSWSFSWFLMEAARNREKMVPRWGWCHLSHESGTCLLSLYHHRSDV
jgi:hypothetical protein